MNKRKRVNLNIQDFKSELATFNGKGEIVYSSGLTAYKKLAIYERKDVNVFRDTEKWCDKVLGVKLCWQMNRMLNEKDMEYKYVMVYSLTKEGMLHIYNNIDEFRKSSPLIQMLESIDVPYKMILDSKVMREPNIITLSIEFDVIEKPLPMKIKRVYKLKDGSLKELVYWMDKKSRVSKIEINIIENIKEEDRHVTDVTSIQSIIDEMCEGEELIEDRIYEHTT